MRARRAAIVFRSGDEASTWLAICRDYCATAGLQPVALLADPADPQRWRDIVEMCLSGEVEVIVAPDWDHLDPDRTPRLEVVRDPPPRAAQRRLVPRQRRTRPVRRA